MSSANSQSSAGLAWEPIAFRLYLAAAFTFAFAGVGAGRVLLALCSAALIVALIRDRRAPWIPPAAWLAFLYVAVTVTVTLFGVNPRKGIGAFHKLLPWLQIPVAAMLVSSPSRLKFVLRAYTAGLVVLALHTFCASAAVVIGGCREGLPFQVSGSLYRLLVHDDLGANDVMSKLIASGDMQDGQRLAIGVLAALSLLRIERIQSGRRGWVRAALVLECIAILLTFKRGAWLFAVLMIVAAALLQSSAVRACGCRLKTGLRQRRGLVLAILLALVAAVFVPPVSRQIRSAGADLRAWADRQTEKGGRICMWVQVTPALVRQHPFGMGFKALRSEDMQAIAPQVERGQTHLHSNVFQVLVDTGWIGLAVYLIWILRALMDALGFYRRSKPGSEDEGGALAILLMLVGLLLCGLAEYQLGAGQIVLLYGMLIGCAAAGYRRSA